MVKIEREQCKDDVFRFNVVVVEDGTVQLEIKGCTVRQRYLNGPAVKVGTAWVSVVRFDGEFREAVLRALEPYKAQHPAVQWP